MRRRAVRFRLPVLAQDVLLALVVVVMQVQGEAVEQVAPEQFETAKVVYPAATD